MSEQPKDIGQILKAAREKKGFSLDTVQEATKIPIDSLKAIEEGYKVRTLTAFYYKSFVRLYAQYLGLDPAPLLAEISPAPQAVHTRVEPRRVVATSPQKIKEPISLNLFARPLRSQNSKKFLKIAGVAVAGIVAVSLLVGLVRKIHFPKPAPTASIVKVEKKLVKKGKPVIVYPTEPVKRTTVVKSAEIVKPAEPVKVMVETIKKPESAKAAETKVVSTEVKATPLVEAEQNTIPAKAVKRVSVAVRAINNSWLTVRADGSPVFQGILKKGTSDTWTASKTITISGKDIDQLEFEVNGKSIGRLSRRGAPAKKIRITPEGLTVEK